MYIYAGMTDSVYAESLSTGNLSLTATCSLRREPGSPARSGSPLRALIGLSAAPQGHAAL